MSASVTRLPAQHPFDELRLAGDVGLSIAGKLPGQRPFELRIRVSKSWIGAERVAESQVARPVDTITFDQVQMMAAKGAATEELAAGQPAIPAVHVPQCGEDGDISQRIQLAERPAPISRIGFAARPGTAVLPTCSIARAGSPAISTASRIRAASVSNSEGQRSS